MLSCPVNGWTLFSLEGTESQLLSYLDDIAPEWLDQAIHGLKTLQPFCVKGFLEPMRMICVVSYWNCHILVEDDDRDPLNPEEVLHEISHTSMLEFCQQLRDDIRANLEQWVRFVDYHEEDLEEKRLRLEQKLAELDTLIAAREESFDERTDFRTGGRNYVPEVCASLLWEADGSGAVPWSGRSPGFRLPPRPPPMPPPMPSAR